MHANETIAAIATARGRSALAIVRVSGSRAIEVAADVFTGARLTEAPSHTAHFGHVRTRDGREVDQVVATVFRAPTSSTGEDIVEFTCHGGDFAPRMVLERLVEAGARHALPGEFTQRAFLNGKLDLAQAEAVADLIHATSTLAHNVSIRQLRGRYSQLIDKLRADLLETTALIELELDFSEEDVEFADRARLEGLIDRSLRLVDDLLGSYQTGELVRDGVRVVIGGRPNAGKSTLLNALLGDDRAIVSETPGTTRDVIEAEAEIRGMLFRFVDTAGLRQTADLIEAEGVRRAKEHIERADILLYVFDLSVGLDAEEQSFLRDLAAGRPELPVVVIGNKEDLAPGVAPPPVAIDYLPMEARRPEAPAELINVLLSRVHADLSAAESSPIVVNSRHRRHLEAAGAALRRASTALGGTASGDTLALDLRAALHELGAITGQITTEDVLGEIFSRFCIGK
jgi:tRNA modification GTPase